MPVIVGLIDAALVRFRAVSNCAATLHRKLDTNAQYSTIFGRPESLTAPRRAAGLHDQFECALYFPGICDLLDERHFHLSAPNGGSSIVIVILTILVRKEFMMISNT
jgi:hypothetical protein